MRKHVANTKKEHKDRIRWRGHEVTRIEALSDAVFAFAITLLIVSLEVPKDFEELLAGMRTFFPFAVCFFMLFQVWLIQNIFFRRYNLHDQWTIVLNGMLLFVVLFFVYPLKFLFSAWMTTGFFFKEPEQVVQLFQIYSSGFAAIYILFSLMYYHAYRKREELELTDSEVFETRTNIYRNMVMAGIGLLSVMIASLGVQYVGMSGFIYILIGPAIAVTHSRRGKIHRLRFETTPTAQEPPEAEKAE